MVDPVMGDNGRLYRNISPEMADRMKTLCREADILIPNVTEACFLLGREYPQEGCGEALAEELLKSLCDLGPRQVVLTGVSAGKDMVGAAHGTGKPGNFVLLIPKERKACSMERGTYSRRFFSLRCCAGSRSKKHWMRRWNLHPSVSAGPLKKGLILLWAWPLRIAFPV